MCESMEGIKVWIWQCNPKVRICGIRETTHFYQNYLPSHRLRSKLVQNFTTDIFTLKLKHKIFLLWTEYNFFKTENEESKQSFLIKIFTSAKQSFSCQCEKRPIFGKSYHPTHAWHWILWKCCSSLKEADQGFQQWNISQPLIFW